MTTIAWDGRRLAFDSRMVCSGFKSAVQAPKAVLRRYTDKSVLYASTGAAGWLEAWIAWAEAGSVPADRPFGDGGNSTIIRVMDGKAEMCTHGMPYWLGVPAPDAWGSGCEYAIGAMKAGADASTAVRVAADCDVNTGGEVSCLWADHPDGYGYVGKPFPNCACPECHAAARGIEPALGVTHPLDVADLLSVEGYIDAPKLSAVYLTPFAKGSHQEGAFISFTEIRAQASTAEGVIAEWRAKFVEWIAEQDKPKGWRIVWRIRPEYEGEGEILHETGEVQWRAYGRLAMIPPDAEMHECIVDLIEGIERNPCRVCDDQARREGHEKAQRADPNYGTADSDWNPLRVTGVTGLAGAKIIAEFPEKRTKAAGLDMTYRKPIELVAADLDPDPDLGISRAIISGGDGCAVARMDPLTGKMRRVGVVQAGGIVPLADEWAHAECAKLEDRFIIHWMRNARSGEIVNALADVRCGLSSVAAAPQNVTAEALEAALHPSRNGSRVIGRADICTHGYVRITCETCRHNHTANLYPV